MRTEILNRLRALADVNYCEFTKKLLPQDCPLLGVRIPELRRFAKMLKTEGRAGEYLKVPLHSLLYQEELILYALLLASVSLPPEEKIAKIKSFIPHINSWAVCDIFCAALKETKKSPAFFYSTFQPYAKTNAEYQIRFFYVLALDYFITPNFLPALFNIVATQRYVGFYDQMAVAWFLSVAYVKYPEQTEEFILNTPLPKFVFNKTISKISDSFRVTKAAKTRLKALAAAKRSITA